MGRDIYLTQQAQRDLEEIVRYIGQDDPVAADRFGNALYARAQSLLMRLRLRCNSPDLDSDAIFGAD